MPTSTVEDYLKCILAAQQRRPDTLVTMGQIGAALGVAPGTVTAMVKTLAESGLVDYEPYSGVRLSEAGERLATHVLRRHRLIELFLVERMGYDWSEVHDEAEQLEHAVSDRLIERIDEMLGHPSADPHGDPIPDREGQIPEFSSATLLACPLGEPQRVVRVGDQSSDFLRLLEKRGLIPGSRVQVESRSEAADSVELATANGDHVSLGF
ncbi:MAG TPA: metal-dependent transcriptional regulator, partial [Thermoanaerobaculia bacterium]|nr:metal-dependent transcriptional regulator [Thermoanaerobaculia bacterium]